MSATNSESQRRQRAAALQELNASLHIIDVTGSTGISAVHSKMPVSSPSRIPVKKQPKCPKRAISRQYNALEYSQDLSTQYGDIRTADIALAWKYGQAWLKRTKLRIAMLRARQHHQSQILRRTFQAWNGMSRRRWRLNVKADVHSKHRVMSTAFTQWFNFTQAAKRDRQHSSLAWSHAKKVLCSKALKAWYQYSALRQQKKLLSSRAESMAKIALKKSMFVRWKSQWNLRRLRDEQLQSAHKFHYNKLLKSHLRHWREQMYAKQTHLEKMRQGEKHNQHQLLFKCFLGWTKYVATRTAKKEADLIACEHADITLKHKIWSNWRFRLRQSRTLKGLDGEASDRGNVAVQRRYFEHWKAYVLEAKRLREMSIISDNLNKQFLQKRVLAALQRNISLRREERKKEQLAEDLYNRKLVMKAWNSCKARWEASEEIRLLPAIHHASQHYRKQLMEKSFRQLLLYWQWRKRRDAQKKQADLHHKTKLLPKLFEAMKTFTRVEQRKKELEARSHMFRNDTLLVRAFGQWQLFLGYRVRERELNDLGVHFLSFQRLRRAFEVWRKQKDESESDRAKVDIATTHRVLKLQRMAFNAWVAYSHRNQKRRLDYFEAEEVLRQRVLKSFFTRWRKEAQESRHLATLEEVADIHCTERTMTECFQKLRENVQHSRECRKTLQAATKEKNKKVLRQFFAKYKSFFAERVDLKAKAARAEAFHKAHTLNTVFAGWHRMRVERNARLELAQSLFFSQQKQRRQSLLRSVFQQWRDGLEGIQRNRELENIATHHRDHRLMKQLTQHWKARTQKLRKERDLISRVQQRNEKALMQRVLVIWRTAAIHRLVDSRNNTIALWAWSHAAQRKAFRAWLLYYRQVCHRKARMKEALEQRRQRLLKKGIANWLQFADNARCEREKTVSEQQAWEVQRVHRLVRKFALRWRRKVLSTPNHSTRGAIITGEACVPIPNPPRLKLYTSPSLSSYKWDPSMPSQPRATPRIPPFLQLSDPKVSPRGLNQHLPTAQPKISSEHATVATPASHQRRSNLPTEQELKLIQQILAQFQRLRSTQAALRRQRTELIESRDEILAHNDDNPHTKDTLIRDMNAKVTVLDEKLKVLGQELSQRQPGVLKISRLLSQYQ